MNWRKPAYLSYASLRGYRFPALFAGYLREHERGVSRETVTGALLRLLQHCRNNVPYYAELWDKAGVPRMEDSDPLACLQTLPVLTKETIRANSSRLQSQDLPRRQWHLNTSGGSTGEPVRFVQDREYHDRSAAIGLIYNSLLGCEVGDPVVRLWGSGRDLEGGTKSRKARFFNWLTNTTWMNAYLMTPERMREFIQALNRLRPRLILAYAHSAYELAQFAEREGIPVVPQRTVLTSAGTLHPFMRQKIAQVFGCQVFNLYGSREVSDIACERPGLDGLWVAPWGNYVEIVDDAGQPVPPGMEGNIVVTCLMNYAMPLLRYWIGDRGALMPQSSTLNPQLSTLPPGTQVLKHVSGRNVDVFRTRDQTLVDGAYFTQLVWYLPWVEKFQVIQKTHDDILFKVVLANGEPAQSELDDLTARTRRVMGGDCRVEFEFADELPPHPSGKFRYTISEVAAGRPAGAPVAAAPNHPHLIEASR